MSAVAAAVMPVLEAEGRVALEGVDLRARLRDLLCQVTTTQTYRNLEDWPIEAVYTFPLPLGATLLELTVTLGERVLRGTVVERQAAEQRYEEAITDGDGAVLLNEAEPGLFTMSVGNLLPGETAILRFTWALLQDWQGGSLRLRLPTTLAPRYGDAAAAGLRPHEVPGVTLTGETPFTLEVTLEGLLARAALDCPSHPVMVAPGEGTTRLALSGGRALMDRDFVLSLRLEGVERASAVIDRDLEGVVAYASFNPVFPAGEEAGPRSVKVVVDCSGSMAGDSIAQARAALGRILASLRPRDHFNVVLFGSHHRALFRSQVPADAAHIEQAWRALERLDADMGGTEIGAALAAAYALRGPKGLPQDVLLVTDGEVWGVEPLVEAARRSGHRVFTVGVGSAVSEPTVRRLAEATGGACELVSPREDMAERIHRHFKRLLLPRAVGARVRWPAAPSASIPGTLDAVYDGDTVHVFARFPEPPTGTATLEVTLADGRLLTQEAVLRPAPALGETDGASTLARLAAARALPALTDAREGAALAVRHQLMSPWTSYLVVAERAEGEKASELPALRPVPHMLAAGWGGTGREACVALLDAPDSYPAPSPPSARRGLPDSLEAAYLDVPAFLRRAAPPEAAPDIEWSLAEGRDRCMEPPHGDGAGPGGPLGSLVSGLNRAHPEGSRGVLAVATLADLLALGAPEQMLEALRRLLDAGHEERTVVVAFLRALAEGPAGTFLGRNARRAIAKAYKALAVDPTTLASLGAALSALLPPASGASRGGGVG